MKQVCFIHTETNGLHHNNDFVTKKHLFEYARLVVLNYEIGYRKPNGEYVCNKTVRQIVKPRSMYIPEECSKIHGITNEIANEKGKEICNILEEFIKDISTVSVIVSHNIDFHLRTIQGELVRYNYNIDFSKYILIDTIGFYHKMEHPKLKVLANTYGIKDNPSTLFLIRDVFLKLYNEYEKEVLVN